MQQAQTAQGGGVHYTTTDINKAEEAVTVCQAKYDNLRDDVNVSAMLDSY